MNTSLRTRRTIAASSIASALLSLACATAPAVAQEPAPAKMTLPELINLGIDRQPALSAARASLAASQSGYNGVSSLGLGARLLSRDIPVREQQACIGISIAAAALEQAEWDTRYAIVRNYYSIIY